MKPIDLIKKYLKESKMMQLATVDSDQPWVCTVYYAEDEQMNLYWLSLPERRHSQEIAKHSKSAIAIPVKQDQPVIGVQAEGTSEVVTDPKVIASVMKIYTKKYGAGKDFYANFIAGKNKHLLYKFSPKAFVLFDEVNFPENSRSEVLLSEHHIAASLEYVAKGWCHIIGTMPQRL